MRRRAACLLLALACSCARPPAPPGDGDGDGDGDRADAGTIGDPDSDAGPPVVGCEGGSGAAAQPFGNHSFDYAGGALLPSVGAEELDDAVRSFYDYWRATYVRAGCGAGRYYVATDHDDSMTVSEAHGYGMLITAYLAGHDGDARSVFDGMYRYFVDHPSDGDGDLMAWSQDGSCNSNQGAASASDGDLDIAYALLLADRQWGSNGAVDYRGEAERVIAAIADSEVEPGNRWVLLGDWTSPGSHHHNATRSSDIMPGHLHSFAWATGDDFWTDLADESYDLVDHMQNAHAPATGLLPDFIVGMGGSPYPAEAYFLERPVDGAYSYNACRVPWRLGIHYLTTGDARARAAVDPIDDWIRGDTGGDPWGIGAGYWLDGSALPSSGFFSLAFAAPFGAGAVAAGGSQAWVDGLWDAVTSAGPSNYYDDTLKLLAMIAMSGNWWAPESAPCAR